MKIEEKMRGKGKIEKKRERSRTEKHGGGTEENVGDYTHNYRLGREVYVKY